MTTQDTARPPRRPSDVELIALLRQRLNTVEEAAEAFLDVLKTTGDQREAAYRKWVLASGQGPMMDAAGEFLTVYQNTIPERLEAVKALTAALTTDSYTALLQCDDLTEEQLEKWFAPADAALIHGDAADYPHPVTPQDTGHR